MSLLFCSVILLEFLKSWSNLCSDSVVLLCLQDTRPWLLSVWGHFPTGDWPDTVLQRLHTNIPSVSRTLNIHPSDSKADSYTVTLIDFLFYLSTRVGSIPVGGKEVRTILSAWLSLYDIKEMSSSLQLWNSDWSVQYSECHWLQKSQYEIENVYILNTRSWSFCEWLIILNMHIILKKTFTAYPVI